MAGAEATTGDAADTRCGYCRYERAGLERCPECGLTLDEALPHVLRRRRWRENARATIIAFGLLAAVPVALFVLTAVWYLQPNIGLPFGYYGRLNRTVSAIERVPGLTVQEARGNQDVTLEEIWISARLATGESVRIEIPQDLTLSAARRVVLCSMDGQPLGSAGPFPEWSGLGLTLGKGGTLAEVTGGKATSVEQLLEHVDALRAWINGSDLKAPQAEFEQAAAGRAIRVWVE